MKVTPPQRPSTELHYGDPDYADPQALERELRRTGEVCHQCRRCLPLCPAFPKLFDLVDATDREVEGVAMEGFDAVNTLCYHCKLCYNHCPYTPPHEWDVDFPQLMRRHQVARTRRDGIPLARRVTTRTDLLGAIGSLAPVLMNFANRNRLARRVMEKTLGIHRDWVQPSFHRETLDRWLARRRATTAGANGRVALFTTMPFTDTGDLDAARRNAERNVAELLPRVEAGAVVVAPGPSCSLMLKSEYPKLLRTDAASRVAAATRDLMEHLYHLAREKKMNRDFVRPLGRVAYHAPCHLRAQNVGFRARDLLRLAGAEVTLIDACSGVDGTWGMQARFHDESMKVAAGLLDRIEAARPDEIATDCPLSALRIEEALGRKAVHPVVLLHRAYGMADG
jgi:Fe-S oxidoreductase